MSQLIEQQYRFTYFSDSWKKKIQCVDCSTCSNWASEESERLIDFQDKLLIDLHVLCVVSLAILRIVSMLMGAEFDIQCDRVFYYYSIDSE